jgi:hypothetical protein
MLLSTFEKLGKNRFEEQIEVLELLYRRTAFESEAAIHHKTAIAALKEFDDEIQLEFSRIADFIVSGTYDIQLTMDFEKMQPKYRPATQRLMELADIVPEQANLSLKEISRKYEDMMSGIKDKVKCEASVLWLHKSDLVK